MRGALAGVIVVGLGIGWLLPSAPSAQTPAAPTGKPAAHNAQTAVADAPAPVPRETTLQRSTNGHFYTEANVNGQPNEFVVDTGASVVALTIDDARRLGIAFDRSNFQVIGSGASGPVRGEPVIIDRLELDGKEVRQVRAAVLEGLEISLLGQSYLSRINSVTMSGEEMRLR